MYARPTSPRCLSGRFDLVNDVLSPEFRQKALGQQIMMGTRQHILVFYFAVVADQVIDSEFNKLCFLTCDNMHPGDFMNHRAQFVSILLIAVITVAVVTSGFDLQPTIASMSRFVQLSLAITLAGIKISGQNSSPLLLRVSHHIFSGRHPANLIDLNCTRLC